MKITYRIPSKGPYGFVEIEKEITVIDKTHALAEEILVVEQLEQLMALQKGESGEGLTTKEFNAALDEYLKTNSLKNGTELYAKMSLPQQACFQEIKKSLKRITEVE